MNRSDFVRVPGYSAVIIKQQVFNEFSWINTHYRLNHFGCYMPPASIFTSHLVNIVKAEEEDKPLYDSNGNAIIKKEVKELYHILTSDCMVWLSNSFKTDKTKQDSLLIEYGHKVIDGYLIPQLIAPLEQGIMKDSGFVDFEFNAQGLPIKKSAKQEYAQGKNLYLFKPVVDNTVMAFGASSGNAGLSCDLGPMGFGPRLGVFACTEGA